MFKRVKLGGLIVGTLVAVSACADQNDVFMSEMTADAAAVQSTAAGSTVFTLNGSQVDYRLTVTGLSSPVLAVHIHAGKAGDSGPRRVDLYVGPSEEVPDGLLIEGSFTAAEVSGVTFKDLLTAMRTGQVYVNVHTVDVPPGEMRGQIFLEGAGATEITGPNS